MEKTSKKDSIMSMLKSSYVRGFFKKYWVSYLLGVTFLIMIDFLQTIFPIIIGGVIDGYGNGTVTMDNVGKSVTNIIVIAIFIVIGRIAWRYFIFGSSRKIERDIKNDMFEHLEKLSQRYYSEHKTGEIMSYLTNDLEAVTNAMGQGMLMLFDVLALGTFTLYNMITKINFALTIVAVLPLLLISLAAIVLGPLMFKRYFSRQETFAEISDFVQEDLSGMKVIKAFVQQKEEIKAFEKVNKKYFDKNIDLAKLESAMHPIMSVISGLSTAVAVGFGGYIAVNGAITVGDFAAFIQYLGMLVWPMMGIGMTINIITRSSAALKRIETVLNEEVEIKDSPTVKNITSYNGKVEIKNLSYKYPNSDNYVLKNISFTIEKGETLGIVARIGSGKTTLINLLLRLYDVERDSIYIDGIDILDIPLEVLRKNIGYVPQDNFLFSDSIKNNIDLSSGDSSEEKVEEAAKSACVHDNIIEFRDGYETIVGERGVTLSGGQKQRVAIARALIKDPEILILDDSVSAVDTDTEEKILKHLSNERKNKTNIIIAHRISTLQNANHIIVIDNGEIVEQGTHEELVANDKIYNSLYQKQLLEKDIDEEV
ncbi:MAG: ABC transporter ATP-binding protein [Oscillospiraceae bacterium]